MPAGSGIARWLPAGGLLSPVSTHAAQFRMLCDSSDINHPTHLKIKSGGSFSGQPAAGFHFAKIDLDHENADTTSLPLGLTTLSKLTDMLQFFCMNKARMFEYSDHFA